MKKNKFIDSVIIVLVTSVLFFIFTMYNLEHTFAFLTPVMLAVFIMRYEVKDAVIPAIIILIIATLFAVLIKGNFWYHGPIFIVGAITVGFLHGGLSKKLSHLKELTFVIVFDIVFGLSTALLFYLINDPVYAINVEFNHYLASISKLFNINEATVFGQNFAFVFKRSFIEYIIAFGIIEATLTHIFIHLVLKFIYRGTKSFTFSGLNYTLPRYIAIPFALLLMLTIAAPFLMLLSLSETLLIIITIITTITLSLTLLFVHQAVVLLSLKINQKIKFNLSPVIYVIGIILFVPFAIIGIYDSLFKVQEKLLSSEAIRAHNYF